MEKLKRPKTFLSASNRNDVESIKTTFINILEQVIAKDEYTSTDYDLFKTLAYLVRAKMMKKWIKTQQHYHFKNKKRVYYLSLEFLIGRLLEDSVLNLGIEDNVKEALKSMSIDYEKIINAEPDAGLGNGGLGRLAACFLDSIATLGIPCHGYGIRYNYGMFRQDFKNGAQVEKPDDWLKEGNPWEIERSQYSVRIQFYGRTEKHIDSDGDYVVKWVDTRDVLAMPYDTPVPGFGNNIVNTLRLWSSRAVEEFNFDYFHHGDYFKACENLIDSENITKILYPNDSMSVGKELRLKQQYFFVSASIQDIVRRFKVHNSDFKNFPNKVVIQLNDTHPTIAIPELMMILLDVEKLPWDNAWEITQKTFAYSNHTLMPEALEKWSVDLFSKLLPRHMEIIQDINHRFLEAVRSVHKGDDELISRVSIIEESSPKMIRMAYLATITCFSINGVSKLHTRLLKKYLLKDFYLIFPDKFNCKTNGITQRRWLFNINEPLSILIDKTIGNNWLKDLNELKKLAPFADSSDFREKWHLAKVYNKERLAKYIFEELGIKVEINSIFDVQAKRIHEYKRQILCLMHAIYQYNRFRNSPNKYFQPRVIIFAGKAAPAYEMAKLIINLINNVADVINNDPMCSGKLNVIFLKDYNVSLASKIIPACDLSEQISTAGFEASGTGNMKFALNGALTIGTHDGANIEIMEEVGKNNFFEFGLKENEIRDLRDNGYNPQDYYNSVPELKKVIDMIKDGFFSRGCKDLFYPIYEKIMLKGDYYMLMADFENYVEAQQKVSDLFGKRDEWLKKSILNVANMGCFSSDNTINEYAKNIWKVK